MWTKREIVDLSLSNFQRLREQLHRIEKKAELIHQEQTKQHITDNPPKVKEALITYNAIDHSGNTKVCYDELDDSDVWARFLLNGEVVYAVKQDALVSVFQWEKDE